MLFLCSQNKEHVYPVYQGVRGGGTEMTVKVG